MKTSPLVPAVLLLAPLLAAPLSAQKQVYIPDAGLNQSTCNVIPFGSDEAIGPRKALRYQTLLLKSQVSSSAQSIVELGFAPCGTGSHRFDTVRIRLAHVNAKNIGTDFAKNLGTASTLVLDAREYEWHHKTGEWSRIGLQNAFAFDPRLGDLLIDIEVHGAIFTGSKDGRGFLRTDRVPRIYAVNDTLGKLPQTGVFSSAGLKIELSFDLASTGTFGSGCTGSNKRSPKLDFVGAPRLGRTVQCRLQDSLPTTAAVFLLGSDNSKAFLPLPLAGTKSCRLYFLPITVTPTLTNQGMAAITIPIPNSATLSGARFYTQWFALDVPANRVGLTTSNYGRVLVGR